MVKFQGIGAISVTDPKIDNNRVANAADGDVIARLAFLGFDVFTQRKSNLSVTTCSPLMSVMSPSRYRSRVAEWVGG